MKVTLGIRIISSICILTLALTSCSSKDANESDNKNRNSNSTAAPRQKPLLSQSEFAEQVQVVCDSVDPAVFDAILGVDPRVDKDFQAKFDEATIALDGLNSGFSAIKPPVNKSAEWQKGLNSISALKSEVNLVSEQYTEYVALIAESETNKDPARTIQILSRLVQLAREYTENLEAVNSDFTTVLTVGQSAGISKCKAFEIGRDSK